MDDEELAQRADENWWETWRRAAPLITGDATVEADGVLLASWDVPVAFFNAAFVIDPGAPPGKLVDRAVSWYRDRGVPFMLRVRERVVGDIAEAALAAGLQRQDNARGMVLWPVPEPPPAPAGVEVIAVEDASALDAHVTVAAAAFDMPKDLVRAAMPDRILEMQDTTFLVALVDGVAVASSMVCATGATAGVYNVATVEAYRRKGLGEALTWAAVAIGVREGCDVAILQASAMGLPVYERMGFRPIAPYAQFQSV